MASQTITLTTLPGLATPTLRVFPDGSDTAVSGSPFTLVEATNRKGYYAVTFTGTLAGVHLCLLYSGAAQVASGWVTLVNADGSYELRGEKGDVNAVPAAVVTALRAWAVESGKSFEDVVKGVAAALLGDVTGNGTSYKAFGNAGTERLSVAGDALGNRTVGYSG